MSWNKGLSKETDKRVANHAATLKGRKVGGVKSHSEETKKRISAAMKGNTNAHHRGDRQSYYGNIRMDSRWEVGAARYFDANGIDWRYGERSFILSDGRHYFPDFFIYEDGKFVKLIEVKGYFREANRAKFEMFQKEYPDVVVELWRGPDLRSRGIVDASGKVIGQ